MSIHAQVNLMNAYTSVPRWSVALLASAMVAAPALVGAQTSGPAEPTATGTPIDLQAAIGIALRQSVLVKQSENAVASSETGVSQARNAFLPSPPLNTCKTRRLG